MKIKIDTSEKTVEVIENENVKLTDLVDDLQKMLGKDWKNYELINNGNKIEFIPTPYYPTPYYPIWYYDPIQPWITTDGTDLTYVDTNSNFTIDSNSNNDVKINNNVGNEFYNKFYYN